MKNIHKREFWKKVIIVLLIVLTILVIYLFFYEPNYKGSINISEETEIIAHRGYGVHAPDNSLVGAELAIDNGMDGIDVDGQLTKDGKLIIFHDLTLGRLTNGTGKVADKTAEEMLALDLGSKFNESFNGSYVKTFEDFLVTINGRGIYMVELKVATARETGIEKEAARIIQKHNAHEWVYLSSFNPIVLYRLKKLDPNIHTVMIFMDTNWNKELLTEVEEGVRVDLPWFLRQEPLRRAIRKIVKPDLLSVNYRVEEKTIERLLNKGYPIFLWTPNNSSDIEESLNRKPYGIITDYPILAKEIRENRK